MSHAESLVRFEVPAELVAPLSVLVPTGYSPTAGLTLALNQTMARDGFAGAWAEVLERGGAFQVSLASPDPDADLSPYRTRYLAWLRAVQLGASTYRTTKAKVAPKAPAPPARDGIEFTPPFGLALLATRGVQLLHYPPDDALLYTNYLYSKTNRRWESLLLANGEDAASTERLETIVDLVPIAANGGGAGAAAIAKFATPYAFADYLHTMLSALLTPVARGRATQPVVAYGAPVWQTLASSLHPRDLTTGLGPRKGKGLRALSLVRHGFLAGGPETWVLCANHPSAFMYAKTKTASERAAARALLVEDLVAARWQRTMAASPGKDGLAVLRAAHAYWTAPARARTVARILARQLDEFVVSLPA